MTNHDFDIHAVENNDVWIPIHKTGNGMGDIFVDHNAALNKMRFTLIENHGLHVESQLIDVGYTGPIEFKATKDFIEKCRADGTL